MGRQVLVIEAGKIFQIVGEYFQGLRLLHDSVLIALEKECQWMDKEEAEIDTRFKQIIGYAMLVSPSGRIFTYQRAVKDAHYEEKRLQGKWSIGIGGHVERNLNEGISACIRREIEEEVETFGDIQEMIFLGGINDDSNAVGQVHFGLFLSARTISENAAPKSKEIAAGCFMARSEIAELFVSEDAENWSRICLEYIPRV